MSKAGDPVAYNKEVTMSRDGQIVFAKRVAGGDTSNADVVAVAQSVGWDTNIAPWKDFNHGHMVMFNDPDVPVKLHVIRTKGGRNKGDDGSLYLDVGVEFWGDTANVAGMCDGRLPACADGCDGSSSDCVCDSPVNEGGFCENVATCCAVVLSGDETDKFANQAYRACMEDGMLINGCCDYGAGGDCCDEFRPPLTCDATSGADASVVASGLDCIGKCNDGYDCQTEGPNGEKLAYPRCVKTTHEEADFTATCMNHCLNSKCCESVGNACIALDDTCPCPSCATKCNDGVTGDFSMVGTGQCCVTPPTCDATSFADESVVTNGLDCTGRCNDGYACRTEGPNGVKLAYPRCVKTTDEEADFSATCLNHCTDSFCCESLGNACVATGDMCPCPSCAQTCEDGETADFSMIGASKCCVKS